MSDACYHPRDDGAASADLDKAHANRDEFKARFRFIRSPRMAPLCACCLRKPITGTVSSAPPGHTLTWARGSVNAIPHGWTGQTIARYPGRLTVMCEPPMLR